MWPLVASGGKNERFKFAMCEILHFVLFGSLIGIPFVDCLLLHTAVGVSMCVVVPVSAMSYSSKLLCRLVVGVLKFCCK